MGDILTLAVALLGLGLATGATALVFIEAAASRDPWTWICGILLAAFTLTILYTWMCSAAHILNGA